VSAIRLRSSRNRELGLLLLVAALVAVGFTSVLVARSGVVSSLSLTYAAAFLALLGVAHVALRVALPDADPVLLPAAGLLVTVGIVEIYRLDPTRRAIRRSGSRSAWAASSGARRPPRLSRWSAIATRSAWRR
jgi:hypothetical protein